MKTVFLKLKEGEKTSSKALLINDIITLDEAFIDMGNYLKKDTVGALIHFNSQQIIQLNLTKVSPYILLFFDDSLIFKGATHSIVSGTGSFSIQTEYKHIHDLKLNTIIGLD
jgi:hypothetical protein